jgi:SAM-dependent methyltransferase
MTLADNMEMHARNFQKGTHEDPRFWERLGGAPDLSGKRVLDLGCGLGSLGIHMARRGAAKVLGIDLDPEAVAFANHNLHTHFAQVQDRVRFQVQDVCTYEGPPFDVVVSKDAFEHIIDVAGVLRAVKRNLKPGGRLYVALGPMYSAPFGDHGRLGALVPWGHVLVPEPLLLRLTSRRMGAEVRTVEDLGLNKYSAADFRRAFTECGLTMISYIENQTERSLARALVEPLRRVPQLEKYLTFNAYCIFEKAAEPAHVRATSSSESWCE